MLDYLDKSQPKADEPDPAAVAADPAVVRAERRLQLLGELAEIGMELARALRPVAPAAAATKTPAPERDPIDAFARVSRAVRLTLALEAKTEQDLRDLRADVIRYQAAESVSAKLRRQQQSNAYRQRVEALVIEAMDRETELPADYYDLHEALEERLAWDHAYEHCEERPLRETVERLCHDLCLAPDWSRWAGEGWFVAFPPERPVWSEFRQPSPVAYDIFGGTDGAPADDPPPEVPPPGGPAP